MPQQAAANRNDAKEPLIFLDVDGVLADFDGHARREDKFLPNGKLKYDKLDHEWWVTMPAYAGAKAFYDAVDQMGTVQFLTGPVLNTASYAGKADWVQTFVPERGNEILDDLIICRSEKKCLLAAPGRILVDDRIENIRAWEAKGGIGIHHTGDYKATMRRLQEAMVQLKAVSRPTPRAVNKAPVPKFR